LKKYQENISNNSIGVNNILRNMLFVNFLPHIEPEEHTLLFNIIFLIFIYITLLHKDLALIPIFLRHITHLIVCYATE